MKLKVWNNRPIFIIGRGEEVIDQERLHSAYLSEGFYSLQLEIGDLCHQGCIYCYMNALDQEKNTLSDDQIVKVLFDAEKLSITAIEWLGGEPLLRNSVFQHMALSSELGFRNNVWTGGLPFTSKDCLKKTVRYAKRGLISVHVSTVDPEIYRELHPARQSSDLDAILKSVCQILELGYPSEQMLNSVTFTGLQDADDMIRTIDYFEEEFGIKTSLNVYHTYLRPGTPKGQFTRFIPQFHDIEKVYTRYCSQWGGTDLPMNCVNKQYCSTTVAILCDGSVTPCATIREKDAPNIHKDGAFFDIVRSKLDWLSLKLFKERKNLPQDCQHCKISDSCFGCRSRSYAAGRGIYGKDPTCFRNRIDG